MITQACEDRLDYRTEAPQIQQLAADGAPLQLSFFDERYLAEIVSPDFPGERLVVCKNHALAEERRRNELLDATEQDLKQVQKRIESRASQHCQPRN
jgi:hypothetical protein